MNSMTGYAYKEVIDGDLQISVEIKSVNSRFLDLSVNMPSFMSPIESRIRSLVGEKIVRGKIDLTIRLHDNAPATTISVNTAAALSYANAIKQVSDAIGTSYSDELLKLVIAQEGVLNVDKSYDAEKYWEHIAPVFNEVLAEFCESRAKEGAKLKVDLEKKLSILDECAAFFKEWQPKMEAKFKEQIIARFEELLGDRVDEQRVLTETAALMVRYTINEEIVRLHSHLDSLHREFENETPGKRIDFFCQEANREINTIGSKNQFKEVGAMVVNAKDALENIREQSKNVE
jgi:uncharacterized protein (TIGR00255 family)